MNSTDKHEASTGHMVDYDRYSHMKDWAVLSKSALIADLVGQIGKVTPELVMTDYGCGPGHSSIDAVMPAIEAYRRLDDAAPMVIRHGDQPGNDCNSLLSLIYGADGYRDGDKWRQGVGEATLPGSADRAAADCG